MFCFFTRKIYLLISTILIYVFISSDIAEESFADLYRVEGLLGVYIASRVLSTSTFNNNATSRGRTQPVISPEHLSSVITFDHGATWRPISPPRRDDDGHPIKCDTNLGCSLHLTQKFSQLYPVTRSVSLNTYI